MPNTISPVTLTDDWQSVNALTSGAVPTGVACVIQLQNKKFIQTAISPSKPAETMRGVIAPPVLHEPIHFSDGENDIWLRGKGAIVSIQRR